jgi:hypothetical protein
MSDQPQTNPPEEFTDEQYREVLGFWIEDIHIYQDAADAAQAAMVANMNEETMEAYHRARTALVQGQEIITRLSERFEKQANPAGLTNT